MCTYNTERRLLVECLDSVASQTYSSYTVLIIDNCSARAETIATIQEYCAKYPNFRLISKGANRGLHDSRNVAIKNCDGEYVAFVDSDDVVAKNYLETMAACITKGSHSPQSIVKVGFLRFDDRCVFPAEDGVLTSFDSSKGVLRLLTERIMPSVWGTLFPIVCFDRFVCSEENGVDDMQMNLWAMEKCESVVCSTKRIYGWRNATGSSMKNAKFLHLVDFSLRKWLEYAETQCPEAVPYLKLRLVISDIKCLIVDQYDRLVWRDFFQLLKPALKELKNKLVDRRTLFLSRKTALLYKAILLFPRLYCALYFKHRKAL